MNPTDSFIFRRGDGRVFAARVLSTHPDGTVFAQYCDSQQTLSLPASDCLPLESAFVAFEKARARRAKQKD